MLNFASPNPVEPQTARKLSLYYRSAFEALKEDYQHYPTRANLSPNILERVLRLNIEYHVHTRPLYDGALPDSQPDTETLFFIESHIAGALFDAVIQVRDLVADYSGTRAFIDQYGPFSLLHTKFMSAGISFPIEPFNIFELGHYLRPFDCFWEMVDQVQRAQIWAHGMVTALVCLGLHDGISPKDIRLHLPSPSIHTLLMAREALLKKQAKEHEDYGVDPNAWGTPSAPSTPEFTGGILCYPNTLEQESVALPEPPSIPNSPVFLCRSCNPSSSPIPIHHSAPGTLVSYDADVEDDSCDESSVATPSEIDVDDDFVIKVEEDEKSAYMLLRDPAPDFVSV
ncbi:hypothetical protein RhiJN_07905 [Ceratobasidium sp. AG-Ba]|nr:hypothetical protein RhiJN_07905 [Ceratobasidium sp. AG-Ba]